MTGPYQVRIAPHAAQDLRRLFSFLARRHRPAALRARKAIQDTLLLPRTTPFSCRKATDDNPLLREIVIPFGASGYVALFEIEDATQVTVIGFRHQRESDYR